MQTNVILALTYREFLIYIYRLERWKLLKLLTSRQQLLKNLVRRRKASSTASFADSSPTRKENSEPNWLVQLFLSIKFIMKINQRY